MVIEEDNLLFESGHLIVLKLILELYPESSLRATCAIASTMLYRVRSIASKVLLYNIKRSK